MSYVFMAILADNCKGCMYYKELTERNLEKAINVIQNIKYKRHSCKSLKTVKSEITDLFNTRFYADIKLEFLPCLIIVPENQFNNKNLSRYDIHVFGRVTSNGTRSDLSLGSILKWVQQVITNKVIITKNGLPISINSKSLENIEFIEADSDSDSEEYLIRY